MHYGLRCSVLGSSPHFILHVHKRKSAPPLHRTIEARRKNLLKPSNAVPPSSSRQPTACHRLLLAQIQLATGYWLLDTGYWTLDQLEVNMSAIGAQDEPKAFEILSTEVNQLILRELKDSDKDIASYRMICRTTRDVIDGDHIFWRAVFGKKYDVKCGLSTRQMQALYYSRAYLLRRGRQFDFFRGRLPGERKVVEMLQTLIIESFEGTAANDYGIHNSKNLLHLREFMRTSHILNSARRAPEPKAHEPQDVDARLAATKIMLFQLIFGMDDLEHEIFAFEESQQIAYRHGTVYKIFRMNDRYLNLEWVLESMNYWRKHMGYTLMKTLVRVLPKLAQEDWPSAWRRPITQGEQRLSRNWKGAFAFVDNYDDFYRMSQGDLEGTYFDCGIGLVDPDRDEHFLYSIELDFADKSRLPSGKQLDWPVPFEECLESLDNDAGKNGLRNSGPYQPQKTKSIHFTGKGKSSWDEYKTLGWLNPLPPQGGIPGWQRITFMSHYLTDYSHASIENAMAYEGVVLPGGRMIIGHYWKAFDPKGVRPHDSGPFIMWAAYDPEE
ncbi:Major facilitator superfamily domain general substrate transporter [Pyrenophora seminiperda CCB06]|uniref:Major facilitator superfamily domain general substrate transporter n=1 Tax=Pyrenophora seminiperda CCB06 TaxID=1302712 RepID=A0A3M7M3B2_9PLEO|nr:Major facilitator superfamily domain general substrate transporter [Pyrenophora seminiperda CCB06]